MELKTSIDKGKSLLKKYRYAVLVLLLGIGMVLMPRKTEDKKEVPVIQQQEKKMLDRELADILSKLDGAGEVQVLLTVASGEEIMYQCDKEESIDGEVSTTRISTITVSSADRNETGLVKKMLSPQYRGAIVICEGADQPGVRLAIVDAVSKATGLGADRISVLKMK